MKQDKDALNNNNNRIGPKCERAWSQSDNTQSKRAGDKALRREQDHNKCKWTKLVVYETNRIKHSQKKPRYDNKHYRKRRTTTHKRTRIVCQVHQFRICQTSSTIKSRLHCEFIDFVARSFPLASYVYFLNKWHRLYNGFQFGKENAHGNVVFL